MLTKSLQLSRHQQVLLITSPGYDEEIELITHVALQLGITTSSIVVPHFLQHKLTTKESLPSLITAPVTMCDGMVVLLEYSAKSTPFRMALLNYFTDRRRQARAASMPGVRLAQFQYAAADFKEMDRLAELIGTALLRTRKLHVQTSDVTGRQHTLTFPIRRDPTMCGSQIAQGNWDNVPSGETFALPISGKAQGSVVVNASVPGKVISQHDELVLYIEHGRVSRIDAGSAELADHARSLLFPNDDTRRLKFANANKLCEIGFGVNRAIKQFYGLPIFDEKVYGTIHVAFGRNDQLGGQIRGAAHHDLVIREATVYSDAFETPIVTGGKVTLTARQVQPDWNDVTPVLDRALFAMSSGVVASTRPETGELILEWIQCEGTPTQTRIGNRETSRLAARVWGALGPTPRKVGELMDALLEHNGIPPEATGAALALLRSFGLISLHRQARKQ